jgi:hypothetical protein
MTSRILYIILCFTNVLLAESIKCKTGERYVIRSRRRRLANSYCKPCVQGYYQQTDNHNIEECQACPSGKWTATKSSHECDSNGPPCSKGQVGIVAATSAMEAQCVDCTPGKFSFLIGDGPKCYDCKSGTYTSSVKSETCIGNGPCPKGKYGQVGMSTQGLCSICPVGKHSPVLGSSSCTECDISEYQPLEGQSSCIAKEKCGRWQRHIVDNIKCEYIYKFEWYVALVTLCWINIITHVVVSYVCMCEPSDYMEGCCKFGFLINLGITIWLTTPHPVNLNDGMNHAEWGCIFVFTLLSFTMVSIEYGKYYRKHYCTEVQSIDRVSTV